MPGSARHDDILLSSVLPIWKDPYELLRQNYKQKFAYIVIDRTPTLDGEDGPSYRPEYTKRDL